METVSGYIQHMGDPKVVNTKRGPANTYSCKLSDGNWYKLGFKDFGLSTGMNVVFHYEVSPYGNQVKSVDISSGAPDASASPPTTGGGTSPSRRTFPFSTDDPEVSHIRRSAMHLAANILAPWFKVKAGEGKELSTEDINALLSISSLAENYFMGNDDVLSALSDMKGEEEAEEVPPL